MTDDTQGIPNRALSPFEKRIVSGELVKNRRQLSHDGPAGNLSNVLNNLATRIEPSVLDVVPWSQAVEAAQLMETYAALLSEFPDFNDYETGLRGKAMFPELLQERHKDNIARYIFESQRRLRGITYRDDLRDGPDNTATNAAFSIILGC